LELLAKEYKRGTAKDYERDFEKSFKKLIKQVVITYASAYHIFLYTHQAFSQLLEKPCHNCYRLRIKSFFDWPEGTQREIVQKYLGVHREDTIKSIVGNNRGPTFFPITVWWSSNW